MRTATTRGCGTSNRWSPKTTRDPRATIESDPRIDAYLGEGVGLRQAKRKSTRDKRIEQAVQWLRDGKHRNWKYESC